MNCGFTPTKARLPRAASSQLRCLLHVLGSVALQVTRDLSKGQRPGPRTSELLFWPIMEDPQSRLSRKPSDNVHSTSETRVNQSVSASPEHSRARSKNIRAADQSSYAAARPQIRRRESDADGTRRGRSRTRSISPESAKRKTMRRRRSRSPSRSCSTSAAESQSSNLKKQRSHTKLTSAEYIDGDRSAAIVRVESRESTRSRSKRRKKYRRRSDYAAAVTDTGQAANLKDLREMKRTEGPTTNSDIHQEGRAQDKTESFESVLEEDEGVVRTSQGG